MSSIKITALREKLAALITQQNEVQAQITELSKFENLSVGVVVTYKYGRGEKAVVKTGVVSAIDEQRVAVVSGEGFEQRTDVVFKASLVAVLTSPTPAEALPEGDDASANI
jgi:regulator of RNase E activity RraA